MSKHTYYLFCCVRIFIFAAYLINHYYKCSRSFDNLSSGCVTLSASTYFDLSLLQVTCMQTYVVGNVTCLVSSFQIPDHLSRDEIYGDIPLVVADVSCRINSTTFQPCELVSAVFDPDTNTCRNSVLQVRISIPVPHGWTTGFSCLPPPPWMLCHINVAYPILILFTPSE